MPVPSRTHRAEVKYNVTTECMSPLVSPFLLLLLTRNTIVPHLGLHSAAATGNIGLINYALTHGQPINSVLDGVLPLHAACSGGHEFVVKLLIEQGADVNAPRCVLVSPLFIHPQYPILLRNDNLLIFPATQALTMLYNLLTTNLYQVTPALLK
jgi:hypothetical protein